MISNEYLITIDRLDLRELCRDYRNDYVYSLWIRIIGTDVCSFTRLSDPSIHVSFQDMPI